MPRIIFLCVANSIRSQLGEGIARHLFGSRFQIESAGSFPSQVHPLVLQVLQEKGIETSMLYSKSFSKIDPHGIDCTITLCQEEVCPAHFQSRKKLHWPLPNPMKSGDTLENLRNTRDLLWEKITELKKEYD